MSIGTLCALNKCRDLLCCEALLTKGLRKRTSIIFIWGRANDEWQPTEHGDGVLETAVRVQDVTASPYVVFPGYIGSNKGQGSTGYPGPKVWQDSLMDMGIVNCVPLYVYHGTNTRTEMIDCINWATASGTDFSVIVGITQQTHALRAMLGTVRSLMQLGLERRLSVIPIWPMRIDMAQEVHGSQGAGPYTRAAWIDQEWDRIEKYYEKGDLCSLSELQSYLEWIHGLS